MKITYISNKNSWRTFLVWILCLLFSNIYAAIPAGTTIIFDNSNTNWDAVYIAITSTNNSSKGVDSYEPKYDTWLGKMKSSDGESYIFTTTEEYSGNNISFYNKDISNYDNLWEVEVAISKQYTSPNNTFKASTNPSYNNNRKTYSYSGTWSASPTIECNVSNPVESGKEITLTAENISANCTWEYSTDGGYTWAECQETPSGTYKKNITLNPLVDTMYRVKSNNKYGYYEVDVDNFSFAISGGVNGTTQWDTSPESESIFDKVSEGKYVLTFEFNSSNNGFKVLRLDEGEANYEWTWESEIKVINGSNISGGEGDLKINNFDNGDVVSLVLTKDANGKFTLTAERGYIFKIVADKPNPIRQGEDVTLTVRGAESNCTWSYSYDGINWQPYTGDISGTNNEIIKPKPLLPTFYKAEDSTSESIYHLEVILECKGKTQTHLNLTFGKLSSATARMEASAIDDKGEINSNVYQFSPKGKELHDGFYAVVANPLYCGRGDRTTPDGCVTTSCLGNINSSGDYWYNDIKDHTGETNGGMLMVNCKDKGELIYSYTATNLCENMYMTFSAWFANAAIENSTTPINTRLRVLDENGAEIISARMDVPAIKPSDGWKQGNTAFFSGENKKLTIQIINNGSSGLGNDILIDDIVFMSCVPQVSINSTLEVECGEYSEISVVTEDLEAIFNGQPYFLWQRYDYNNSKWTDIADDPNTDASSNNGSGVGKTSYNYKTEYEPVNKPRFRVVMSSDPEVAKKVGSDIFPVCINYAITDEVEVDCGCAPQKITKTSGQESQTVCQNSNISKITYSAEGHYTKSVGIKGLPDGLVFTKNGLDASITGAPIKPDEYEIKIFAEGEDGISCISDTLIFKLIVKEAPTLTLKDGLLDQKICNGDPTTSLQVEFGGSATSINLTGFPNNLTPIISGNTLEIPSYTPDVENSFSIETVGQESPCTVAKINGSVTFYDTPTAPNIVQINN